MTFSQKWFETAGKTNFDKFVFPEYQEKEFDYLEIGCFEGMATCYLLQHCPKAKVTVVDTFQGGEDQKNIDTTKLAETFKENVAPWGNRVEVFSERSDAALLKLEKTFDVIYIDGSHLAADVLADMVYSWRLLKSGGLMILDDYEWATNADPVLIPKTAIDAFMACFAGLYRLEAKGYQVVLRKK